MANFNGDWIWNWETTEGDFDGFLRDMREYIKIIINVIDSRNI